MTDGSLIQGLTQIKQILNQKQKKIKQTINHKNQETWRTKKKTTRMTGKQIQINETYPTEI